MITGVNGLLFTSEPAAARDALTELLPFDVEDAGDGWLVFDVPESELAVHPLPEDEKPFHQLSFACDDLDAVIDQVEELGIERIEPIEDKGFGLTTVIELPGGVPVEVYEPKS